MGSHSEEQPREGAEPGTATLASLQEPRERLSRGHSDPVAPGSLGSQDMNRLKGGTKAKQTSPFSIFGLRGNSVLCSDPVPAPISPQPRGPAFNLSFICK